MNKKTENNEFQFMKGETFRFRCHKGIDCFTKCCADLKLVLTPYDIIRIKKRLQMHSSDFLEQYTEFKVENNQQFPKVFLRMSTYDGKCPFVRSDGCCIYEDRPGACRIYPIGRASLKVSSGQDTLEKFFLVREEHCLGFKEDRLWTIKEWLANEGLDEYNAMNDCWLEIISGRRSLGTGIEATRKIQMFSMASYNIDQFRDFVFNSRLFDLFEVEAEAKEKMASDDSALLKFAIEWIKFSVFEEKSATLKPKAISL
jgi:Fe-S-cluster containining protein